MAKVRANAGRVMMAAKVRMRAARAWAAVLVAPKSQSEAAKTQIVIQPRVPAWTREQRLTAEVHDVGTVEDAMTTVQTKTAIAAWRRSRTSRLSGWGCAARTAVDMADLRRVVSDGDYTQVLRVGCLFSSAEVSGH
jgi:hypothetical protein